ncbi:hypothetical protein [Actinomadura harenae]|uniref:Secreted protein n=1 Tax=Actinomadura harenae TaxID=2483351 RepID=A0A3M2MC78_9ACTN|nr:hypothetical protein [Actinomadura harenae]RMI46620.1 hypothetical protein EBO15_06765 [Actinomadura harenae]
MKQSVRKAMVGVIAATSVLALTTAPAHATGQGLTTTHPITLTGTATWKDNSTGETISCTKVTGTGTAQDGTPPPNPVAQITSMTFSSPANPNGWCSGPGGILVQITPSGFPWPLSVTGLTGGVTLASLSGIKASFVGSDNCHATVTGPGGAGGTVSGTYNISASVLATGGTGSTSNLTAQTVDFNCDPTLINAGDSFSMRVSLTISPPLNLL